MRRILLRLTFLLALGLAATPARSQSIGRAFSLFLDCRDLDCESDFYRQETAFVDHVRERTEADVHLLVTQQQTGSGGSVRLGLARYLARTPEGEQAALTLTSSELAIPPRATAIPETPGSCSWRRRWSSSASAVRRRRNSISTSAPTGSPNTGKRGCASVRTTTTSPSTSTGSASRASFAIPVAASCRYAASGVIGRPASDWVRDHPPSGTRGSAP